ncbi:hypothetical protein LTR70_006007 [Exophiala xenobiotica]|uniref:Uncharacterized protein n=1 Tax=Lithohypha guttulata TaxID=1690604 RepID=A0ABR0KB33_9EURO|nr:hypothetical protein LTR24_004801 [Lithohypha guttulata]KAK5316976.1 hypothetical protein LTR70_006007 [Exophiala xenobiotica]
MSLLSSIKPFWPFLFTFVLPRAYGYLNALKTAYRTRPPPKPLPPRVDRSLNILFCSVVFFLAQSFRRGPDQDLVNVFSTTSTRLGVPSDVLFARLAMLRPNGILNDADQALRSALTTKESRMIYLTYGPSTLLDCSFCHPSQPQTYTLYSLPTTVFLPHLIHLIVLGVATSAALTSPLTATSRMRIVIPALLLLAIDIYLNTFFAFDPTLVSTRSPSPTSLFALLRTIRPLSICFLDVLSALYLWTTNTGRFILFPFLSDPNAANNTSIDTLQVQTQDLVRNSGVALQTVQAKLRAYSVARNTVNRDTNLKAAEDGYWREVTRREAELAVDEGGTATDNDEIYQDEEVQAAIARVYGQGGVDVPRARREADAFVDGVTQGLENAGGGS